MLAAIFKFIGLLIAALGAALALLGDTTSGGRLTRRGKQALALLVVGFIASVAIEVRSLQTSRATERWEVAKALPITEVVYEFLTAEPHTAESLIGLLNGLRISFAVRSPTDNEKSSASLKWTYRPDMLNAKDAISLVLTSDRGATVPGQVDLFQRSETGWSSSINDDWTDKGLQKRLGGLKTRICWFDHGFSKTISEVSHLGRMTYFGVVGSTELNRLQKASITFLTAGQPAYSIDLKTLRYIELIDKTPQSVLKIHSASLTGEDLLLAWKESLD